MPGKVRVKIIAGRNLPVMDRSNDTADAFVEIKLANISYKTEVYRKSLNPQWNTDFYRFELDDAELQDEPLQIKLMDHDTYTANDAIGKVSISLNPLLLPSFSTSGQTIVSEKGAVMAGWIPVFDTMHGIRGEVNIVVKVDLFSDVNKFRQSSCGVKFFHSPNIPHGYHAQIIHGFVEELVVNDDPEYQWIDKIRTPRASNDARQLVFLRLSGQVQRKIGLKAIDLGANSVIGYTQCFDLEGDVGVVARGIGTAVTLERNPQTQLLTDFGISEEQLKYLKFLQLCDKKPEVDSKFDAVTNDNNDASNSMFSQPNRPAHILVDDQMVATLFKQNPDQNNADDQQSLSSLKMLLEQEDNRGLKSKSMLKSKMQRMHKSSKSVLTKKILSRKQRDDSELSRITAGLTESLTELSVRYSPSATLRNSISDIGGVFKKRIGGGDKYKFERSSSEGAGMAALLVSSMMAAPSLKSISETLDASSVDQALAKHQQSNEDHSSYPSNICIKESDSNLSSYSLSSSISSLSEKGSGSEAARGEVQMEPETVSMVVQSVLAREQSIKLGHDMLHSSCNNMKTFKWSAGLLNVNNPLQPKASNRVNFSIESTSSLDKFLLASDPDPDSDNWIQPGSTVDEPETNDEEPESRFHELKENLFDTIHSIQEHIHLPSHDLFPQSHSDSHIFNDAIQNMLKEQVVILEASTGGPVIENTLDTRNNKQAVDRSKSFRQRISSFCHRSKDRQPDNAKVANICSSIKIMLPKQIPTIRLSSSLTDLHKDTLYDKISYGSAIELSRTKVTAIEPFASLPDLSVAFLPNVDQTFDNRNSTSNLRVGLATRLTTASTRSTDSARHATISTNPASLLAPLTLITNRLNDKLSGTNINANTVPLKITVGQSNSKKDYGHVRAESSGCKIPQQSPLKSSSAATSGPSSQTMTSSMGSAGKEREKESVCRRSSDSDLSVTPKANSLTDHRPTTQNYGRSTNKLKLRQLNPDNIDMLEYPFLTLSKYPKGFIIHIGATVCARSVKLLERVPNPDEPETRDSWWTELRMEIRSHARALGCNVILGYSEVTSISDDVCVLSVTGTAAIINLMFTSGEIGLLNTALTGSASKGSTTTETTDRLDSERDGTAIRKNSPPKSHGIMPKVPSTKPKPIDNESFSDLSMRNSSEHNTEINCSICHIPYSRTSVPFNEHMKKCSICKKGAVPDVLLATIEIPDSVQITGRGCFLQAQVCRAKKDLKSESNAKEISDCLPFLEYDLHRLLINKLKIKGMNAIFGLRSTVTIGEKVIALIATGTAVFLSALPAPTLPKIIAGNSWTNTDKLNELQRSLKETIDRNREVYQLKSLTELELDGSGSEDSEDEGNTKANEINLNTNNKGTFVLEVDDVEDLELIALLMEPSPPDGFHVVNTQSVPGLQDLEVVRNLQMFTQIWRAKLSCSQQQGNSNFAKHFQRLLQTIFFKLRTMIPCAICDLRFRLELPDTDEIQLLVTGMALGLGKPSAKLVTSLLVSKDYDPDDELMFRLEEENGSEFNPSEMGTMNRGASFIDSATDKYMMRHHFPQSGGSLKLGISGRPQRFNSHIARPMPLRERYGVELTPLCYVPGGYIQKYLGNLNFFFIRESTSIRESGGVSGFVHSFITEMLAVVRAHVTALGGNALVSFYMTELSLVDNPHKNQGQCLISVGGDVVFVSYFTGGE